MDTEKLLWLHAFGRRNLAEKWDVLNKGRHAPSHHPTDTQNNESILEIDGPCVYAYLGRTKELFGNTAFAIKNDHIVGAVSPFDTGGLVTKIAPVCSWDNENKSGYLRDYTWDSSALARLLDIYPSDRPGPLEKYLQAEKPDQDGPYRLWTDKTKADIWKLNDDWRCWTWEVRCKSVIHTGPYIEYWTCPPEDFAELQGYIDKNIDSIDHKSVTALVQKYVDGGVSALVRRVAGL